jgi:ABC-type dipeptide/oligopeptide/nickel transport system permease subunit
MSDSPLLTKNNDPALLASPADSPWRDARRRFFKNKLAVGALIFIVLLGLAAIFAPLLTSYEPDDLDVIAALDPAIGKGLSAKHWLGLDKIGRDMWTRLLFGARVSLTVAVVVTFVSTLIGVVLGALAAWRGKWVDTVIMRTVDVLSALPYIVFITFFVARFGNSMTAVILAIVATGWGLSARQFRAGMLQAMGTDYVEAAKASGVKSSRIVFRHILPNVIQPMIVGISFAIGTTILVESIFSFLGVGIVNEPAWGLMVSDGRDSIFTDGERHIFLIPAAALSLTVLAFTFIGEGVRDALDPKLKGV